CARVSGRWELFEPGSEDFW
nr:immunoglobulin heavy chain junction region [Macaca mulatta]MOX59942.1 immunoglobulin heavy chain junction region [Macaca mulatta]MOX60833.1 immunoglobulin heavy chain junction region [Macaca mulatta]MOX63256.1 immunoglobulin heavy chain junction region [Macaca mulatta]MOX64027.1 immunoglobulin heavy chain junction region [Macaca mulatta]